MSSRASAVFAVNRAWSPAPGSPEPQFFTSGQWSVVGTQAKLHGELRDFPGKRLILQQDYSGPVGEWRRLLHRFSDDCVQQITGERGVADSRIAFVVREGRDKELWVMDADGFGARALTADRSIAQSPAWSPEGSLLLFTSWRGNNGPGIWVLSPDQKKPFLVSGRPGLNTSASYSPDGQRVVCTLSIDGNAEVYSLDARGGSPRRLTSHRGIDTSPAWSPTGREIAFTSDRAGGAGSLEEIVDADEIVAVDDALEQLRGVARIACGGGDVLAPALDFALGEIAALVLLQLPLLAIDLIAAVAALRRRDQSFLHDHGAPNTAYGCRGRDDEPAARRPPQAMG